MAAKTNSIIVVFLKLMIIGLLSSACSGASNTIQPEANGERAEATSTVVIADQSVEAESNIAPLSPKSELGDEPNTITPAETVAPEDPEPEGDVSPAPQAEVGREGTLPEDAQFHRVEYKVFANHGSSRAPQDLTIYYCDFSNGCSPENTAPIKDVAIVVEHVSSPWSMEFAVPREFQATQSFSLYIGAEEPQFLSARDLTCEIWVDGSLVSRETEAPGHDVSCRQVWTTSIPAFATEHLKQTQETHLIKYTVSGNEYSQPIDILFHVPSEIDLQQATTISQWNHEFEIETFVHNDLLVSASHKDASISDISCTIRVNGVLMVTSEGGLSGDPVECRLNIPPFETNSSQREILSDSGGREQAPASSTEEIATAILDEEQFIARVLERLSSLASWVGTEFIWTEDGVRYERGISETADGTKYQFYNRGNDGTVAGKYVYVDGRGCYSEDWATWDCKDDTVRMPRYERWEQILLGQVDSENEVVTEHGSRMESVFGGGCRQYYLTVESQDSTWQYRLCIDETTLLPIQEDEVDLTNNSSQSTSFGAFDVPIDIELPEP